MSFNHICVCVCVVSESRDSEWYFFFFISFLLCSYVDSELSELLVFTATVVLFPWWLAVCVLLCLPLRVWL